MSHRMRLETGRLSEATGWRDTNTDNDDITSTATGSAPTSLPVGL